VLTGILLYAFQKVIDERSAKRLEMFKTELRSTSFEGEIKFSKLHEIRSAVIAELYQKLFRLREALSSLKLFLEDPDFYVDIVVDEKLGDASSAEEDFRVYFQANRLYFPENICNQIDSIYNQFSETIKILSNVSFDMRLTKMSNTVTLASKHRENHVQGLLRVSFAVNEQIDPLLKQLENDFRNLLGS
jgi:hypothetical protein